MKQQISLLLYIFLLGYWSISFVSSCLRCTLRDVKNAFLLSFLRCRNMNMERSILWSLLEQQLAWVELAVLRVPVEYHDLYKRNCNDFQLLRSRILRPMCHVEQPPLELFISHAHSFLQLEVVALTLRCTPSPELLGNLLPPARAVHPHQLQEAFALRLWPSSRLYENRLHLLKWHCNTKWSLLYQHAKMLEN